MNVRVQMELPSDIWHEVLSYQQYPSNRRVNREFEDIEQRLVKERAARIKKKYPNLMDVFSYDMRAVWFILLHPDLFTITIAFANQAAMTAIDMDDMDLMDLAIENGADNWRKIAVFAFKVDDIPALVRALDHISFMDYINAFMDKSNNRIYLKDDEEKIILDLFMTSSPTLDRLFKLYPRLVSGVISNNIKILRRKYGSKVDHLVSNLPHDIKRKL